MLNYKISETLENVTEGKLNIKIEPVTIIEPDSYSSYLLEKYFLKLNFTNDINLTEIELRIEIRHLNAADPINFWIASLIILIYFPLEVILLRKRKI